MQRLFSLIGRYLGEGRALHEFDGPQVSRQLVPALGRYGALLVLSQFLHGVAVVPQVHLGTNQQERSPGTVVRDFWDPLQDRRGERVH